MREEMMKLRFQQVAGQLTDTSRLRILRREIARMETILPKSERGGIGRCLMNNRRRMTGVVTSNKMQKTVVVEIKRTSSAIPCITRLFT
jgi:ribosomal protein L29